MITIVDYGVGNIGALTNMFDYIGVDCVTSSEPSAIAVAERLLLPGVGAFDKAMSELRDRSLVKPLQAAVANGTPLLGICLGMQLLARRSDEGSEAGLHLLEADVLRIPQPDPGLKVPHMGWAEPTIARTNSLFPTKTGGERFYFAHSYHVVCDDEQDVVATLEYGAVLTCAVQRANVYGAQFHPEKSHRYGMRVLKAFAEV